MLCAVRVPGEPVLTTTATCGTVVGSSLSSAGLPQWSKLKCMLQMFIHSYLELRVQLKSQDKRKGVMVMAFMWRCKVLAQCAASALLSSAEVASSGTQHLARKLDCACGKSQLFHTTVATRRCTGENDAATTRTPNLINTRQLLWELM